ncbi:MAG: hypothetical protein ACXWQ6_08435 [Candidatus Limnocylindrales bacterium]
MDHVGLFCLYWFTIPVLSVMAIALALELAPAVTGLRRRLVRAEAWIDSRPSIDPAEDRLG